MQLAELCRRDHLAELAVSGSIASAAGQGRETPLRVDAVCAVVAEADVLERL